MKIKKIAKYLIEVLLPKTPSENELTSPIIKSVEMLDYYGSEYDKKNLKSDLSTIGSDFTKMFYQL